MPKFLQITQVEDSQFLAGFSADVTRTGKASPVAEQHPTVAVLHTMFPLATANFGLLTEYSQGYERIDVIGKVALKETPPTKVPKVTLWLKDESQSEVAVNLWGNRLTKQAEPVQNGDVVQIDNALLSRKLDGSVEAGAEHWMDSVKNMFAALHTTPAGERGNALRQLSDHRGEAVPTPWLQTGANRLTADGLEKIISCCATVAACLLSSSNQDAEAWKCCCRSCFWMLLVLFLLCPCLLLSSVSFKHRHRTPSLRCS